MKLFALLFVTAVLISSFAVSVFPTASALTARSEFNDRHTSASYGNSKICGDHPCGPGEKTQWASKMAQLQRGGNGKIGNATTYHDVLKYLESSSTSDHKIIESEHHHLKMSVNATKSENVTKNTN